MLLTIFYVLIVLCCNVCTASDMFMFKWCYINVWSQIDSSSYVQKLLFSAKLEIICWDLIIMMMMMVFIILFLGFLGILVDLLFVNLLCWWGGSGGSSGVLLFSSHNETGLVLLEGSIRVVEYTSPRWISWHVSPAGLWDAWYSHWPHLGRPWRNWN